MTAQTHLVTMRQHIARAMIQMEGAGTLEADEKIIVDLANSLIEQLAAMTEERTDERIFDAIGEPVIEAIQVAFMDARDRRDKCRSSESRAAYAADMERARA